MNKFFNHWFKREAAGAKISTTTVTGGSYVGGVSYVTSPAASLKVSAVFRAVALISDSVGALPLEYKRLNTAKDYFKDYGASRLYHLLTVQPNARLTAYVFFKNLVSQILLLGNAYVFPRRDLKGEIAELLLCAPHTVVYDLLSNTYTVTDFINSIFGTYTASEMLHFKNVSLDGGYTGASTISFAAQTLGIAATADKETLNRFATGGKIKGLYHNDNSTRGFGSYQDEQLKAAAGDIQTALNSGQDIIAVPGDGKLEQLSMSSTDLQFLESRKFTVTEIARFFSIPKQKLFDDTNSNYKSSEMSTVEFYSDALAPILTMIEQEFRAKLVPFALLSNYKFTFDVEKLYTTDLTTKATWNTSLLATGQKTINDLRRAQDLPPVAGGDEIYITCNVQNVIIPDTSK